jgi:hypothetical protein
MRAFIRFLAPSAFLLTLLAPAGAATAAPATSERFEDVTFLVSSCNNEEMIQGEVIFHEVTKEKKGDIFIQKFNVHGRAVGDQGNEYVVNQDFKYESTSDFSSESFVSRFRLTSKGSAPNEVVIFRFEDGEFTVESDCRG